MQCYLGCIFTKDFSTSALLKYKGGDEVSPNLSALKNEKEDSKVASDHSFLGFFAHPRVVNSCSGDVSTLGRPQRGRAQTCGVKKGSHISVSESFTSESSPSHVPQRVHPLLSKTNNEQGEF